MSQATMVAKERLEHSMKMISVSGQAATAAALQGILAILIEEQENSSPVPVTCPACGVTS